MEHGAPSRAATARAVSGAGVKTVQVRNNLETSCTVVVDGGVSTQVVSPHGISGILASGGRLVGRTTIRLECADASVFVRDVDETYSHCDCTALVGRGGPTLSCACRP